MIWGELLDMATTLRRGTAPPIRAPLVTLFGLGILMLAKSRCGSHISVTDCGRYEPTAPATLRPTSCEERRSMPPKVPLCLFVLGPASGVSPPRGDEPVLLLGEYSLLSMLRDRDQRFARGVSGVSGSATADPPALAAGALTRRKMWTVSEVDETHSKVELRLNDMLYMVEG